MFRTKPDGQQSSVRWHDCVCVFFLPDSSRLGLDTGQPGNDKPMHHQHHDTEQRREVCVCVMPPSLLKYTRQHADQMYYSPHFQSLSSSSPSKDSNLSSKYSPNTTVTDLVLSIIASSHFFSRINSSCCLLINLVMRRCSRQSRPQGGQDVRSVCLEERSCCPGHTERGQGDIDMESKTEGALD